MEEPILTVIVINIILKAMILYILADFWPVVLMGLIAIVSIVLICCSLRKKKKKATGIYAIVISVCIMGSIIWCVLFPTAYPYVDLWVLGKTEEEIIEVYGEPDYDESWRDGDDSKIAYYTKYIIFDPDYYIITFDEEGKAIDVEEGIFKTLGG